MKRVQLRFLALGLLVFPIQAPAQLPGGMQSGLNAALVRLFDGFTAFSAQAEVSFQDKDTRQQIMMPMGFALLDGKVRLDLDLNRIKSAQVSTQMLASLKGMGLDRVTTVLRPDRKAAVLIYPALTSYVEMPMAADEAKEWQRRFTLEKERLGKETVEGKACEKFRVTLTGDNGARHEATVWYAAELKQFPVKLHMAQTGANVTMQFRDVSFQKPAEAQFEPNAGYTSYKTVELLTQAAMLKALGGRK